MSFWLRPGCFTTAISALNAAFLLCLFVWVILVSPGDIPAPASFFSAAFFFLWQLKLHIYSVSVRTTPSLQPVPTTSSCQGYIVMADNDRRPKRSRFDQTEPEPRRPSRFDRRSRSPPSRQSETRTRSPLSREPGSPTTDSTRKSTSADPAAAAGMVITLCGLFLVWG